MLHHFLQHAINGDLAALKEELAVDPKRAKLCNSNRDTALGLAALNNHVECVRLLLPLSNPNIATVDWGRTPLMLAAGAAAAECVELLLPVSDPLLCDLDKRSALMLALKNGSRSPSRERCLDLLWPLSDLKAKDCAKNSVLMYAARNAEDRRVELLLPHRQPKAKNHMGATELACAIMGGSERIVRALLPGSILTETDKSGNTLLHLAATDGFEASLSLLQLVMTFAPKLKPNGMGETPLDVAQREECWDKVDLLADALSLDALSQRKIPVQASWLPRQRARWEKEQLRLTLEKNAASEDSAKRKSVSSQNRVVSGAKAKRV